MQKYIVMLSLLIFLHGCSSALLSRAYVDPKTGWSNETAGRGQRIIGPSVEIYVKASNSISKMYDETKSDTFGVSMYFVPRIENLEFIPSEVTLRLPGLPVVKPKRFELQVTGNNSGLDMRDCGHYNYPKVDFGSGPQYILRKGFCIDLDFDVKPPSPTTEFMLKIPDLTNNGERIEVPEILFKQGDVRVIDFPIR